MAGDSETRLNGQADHSNSVKQPFLIGVSGGTASGKVRVLFQSVFFKSVSSVNPLPLFSLWRGGVGSTSWLCVCKLYEREITGLILIYTSASVYLSNCSLFRSIYSWRSVAGSVCRGWAYLHVARRESPGLTRDSFYLILFCCTPFILFQSSIYLRTAGFNRGSMLVLRWAGCKCRHLCLWPR